MTPMVEAVQSVLPTVVNISTERVVETADPFNSFFNEFFGRHRRRRLYRQKIPLGSGVIVDPAGLVLTNYHVVRRATDIHVQLFEGRDWQAKLIAHDAANDLALLQLLGDSELQDIKAVKFAAPGDLYLGETVITVGNPFGLEHSVSSGVLSARNRTLTEDDIAFNDILQTDAAINPGNSGGPLINLDGELIGINIAIRRDAEGIGFAIPVKRIENVLAHWLVPSQFSTTTCGLIPGTEFDQTGMRAIVQEVIENSPAAQAGLASGDCIVEINGQAVRRALDVGAVLWRLQLGDIVNCKLKDGKEKKLIVAEMTPELLVERRLGLRLQELDDTLRQGMGLPDNLQGLIIRDVLENSQFAAVNVRRGDMILQVAENPVVTQKDLANALNNKRPGDSVPILFIAMEQIRDRIYLRRFILEVVLR